MHSLANRIELTQVRVKSNYLFVTGLCVNFIGMWLGRLLSPAAFCSVIKTEQKKSPSAKWSRNRQCSTCFGCHCRAAWLKFYLRVYSLVLIRVHRSEVAFWTWAAWCEADLALITHARALCARFWASVQNFKVNGLELCPRIKLEMCRLTAVILSQCTQLTCSYFSSENMCLKRRALLSWTQTFSERGFVSVFDHHRAIHSMRG